VYEETIHVADVVQDMLLGFDLLNKRCVLDMVEGILKLDGEDISLREVSNGYEPVIARISVAKRKVVPPNSAMYIPCNLDYNMRDVMVEPNENLKIFMPKTLHKEGKEAIVCVLNTSNKYRVMKKGSEVGMAVQVAEVIQQREEEHTYVGSLSKTSTFSQQELIPDHLKVMYERSINHLNKDQKDKLAATLCSYKDVFAESEFDLGNFTEFEHGIDTGNAKPVKQRMRRTPACFVNEEEAHLKKMLDAKVIQESTSEWASAPVLIRKRDNSVRWCIDYRALNDCTVKDVFPLPLVDDCLENYWFSKLDANSAYWQIKIKEKDRHKI
jgi:hypothetical protein